MLSLIIPITFMLWAESKKENTKRNNRKSFFIFYIGQKLLDCARRDSQLSGRAQSRPTFFELSSNSYLLTAIASAVLEILTKLIRFFLYNFVVFLACNFFSFFGRLNCFGILWVHHNFGT